MIYKIVVPTLFLLLFACSTADKSCNNKPVDYTQWVDPYIGTDDHGHVFLGANVPFGAVQVGPTNYVKGWDWCSGYHYSDSILTGFSQMHLSGTGIGDLGDVLITPFTGEIKTTPGTEEDPLGGYASKYNHNDEIAKAGYYAVTLKRYNIRAELTASNRVAFHKYVFPGPGEGHIAINLTEGIGWDRSVDNYLKQINDTTFIGYRYSTGWAKDQRLFFAISVSQPIKNLELFNSGKEITGTEAKGNAITGILSFQIQGNHTILLKVGISPVSEDNAMANIKNEIQGWNFNKIVTQAHDAWNHELGKITIKTGNIEQLRTFYTALYHAFIAPVTFNDFNKDYRGADGKVHTSAGFTNYSIYSLWDTYRAEHPLFTLVQPERVSDMVNTMLTIYKQQGKLPIWHLMGNETDCMVGYSAVPVLADAYFKGFTGFSADTMLEAMKASSTRDDYGVNYLKKMGYIPADKEKESVSKALEYAISDWCIAQVAKKMDKSADYKYYLKRGEAYKEYFDRQTKFMRAKLANGKFREPFNPFHSIHEWGDYTEGNAWQYTWLVPQDVEGLIALFGSDSAFVNKLDSLFIIKGDLGENASPDISGLIGQYAQGNEPGHHIPYLYAYAGEQWKTAEKIRYITTNLYNDKPDGLCGNEDCGQMSAWFILSAVGFYPINPAGGAYVFGSPLFDEVILNLPRGKHFTLRTINNSRKNKYIRSAKLNGQPYNRSYIIYKEIMSGGTLELVMDSTPNKNFGKERNDRPKSIIYE
jgi:predicted alpha-1,2-mannosidase